tara:strand:+ start:9469 stop:10416 length:948 start_codon:yes stop_codon:yes gene_type:complete
MNINKADELEPIERFFYWINERHAIYQKRIQGFAPPWTDDSILQSYKFTNPFRENDKVTIWMRQNWTKPNGNRPMGEILFNCCLFRMVGTIEFADEHKWVYEDYGWSVERTKETISARLEKKLRTFTGAYIITNQGLKLPKGEVVVDHFLKPIWENKERLAEVATKTNSLQEVHRAMLAYKGWGGGGFMSYEVVTDLNHTNVLDTATDRFTWANAGPGAKRGLNRIHEKLLTQAMSQHQANTQMQNLLQKSSQYLLSHVPIEEVDMRTIEHSLCEWDKWERVRLEQGTPRSKYDPVQAFKDKEFLETGSVGNVVS